MRSEQTALAVLGSLVALPLLAGALLAVVGRRADRVAPGTGVLVAVGVLALAVAAALDRPAVDAPLLAGIRAGLAVDGLSALMVVTVAGATLAVLAFAAGDAQMRTARFVGLVLLFAGAMLVTVTANTLAVLLMAWEVMGALSWALVAYHWREQASVRAAHTAFLTTRAADLGLYVAAGAMLAGGVGSLAVTGVPVGPWLHVAAAGVVLAALGKSAQLPFSFWLAQAMRGPSPVSALLHSATMVAAGAYLLLRTAPLLAAAGWAGPAVAWAGAATAVLLGLVAVAQTDLKQLLAASTCAQIGFTVLAAGVASTSGGALQLAAHAATKSLLFLAAGAWLLTLGTKQLGELRGAARRFPLVGVTFTVGAAALAGLPPLSLWLTKDVVLAAALDHGPALYVAGLAAAVLSAVYSTKATWFVWAPTRSDERHSRRLGTDENAVRRFGGPLVALAVLAAVLGAPVVVAMPATWELLVSGALAVAAAGVTWGLASFADRARVHGGRGSRARRPRLADVGGAGTPRVGVWMRVCRAVVRPLRAWLGFERAAHAVVVRPVLGLARALAAFDDRVLTTVVTGTARSTRAVAAVLDRRGEGAVDGAVRAVAAASRALGRLARHPQTGQVHQYYAQAAAALAVLALLVIVVR
ncbi:MAG TPA: proton-conducting transporter membrane subunit [Pseudonocardia sp.]|nr:proton-conducting transporter membrane subunit [Pseudonocardia sp.]